MMSTVPNYLGKVQLNVVQKRRVNVATTLQKLFGETIYDKVYAGAMMAEEKEFFSKTDRHFSRDFAEELYTGSIALHNAKQNCEKFITISGSNEPSSLAVKFRELLYGVFTQEELGYVCLNEISLKHQDKVLLFNGKLTNNISKRLARPYSRLGFMTDAGSKMSFTTMKHLSLDPMQFENFQIYNAIRLLAYVFLDNNAEPKGTYGSYERMYQDLQKKIITGKFAYTLNSFLDKDLKLEYSGKSPEEISEMLWKNKKESMA